MSGQFSSHVDFCEPNIVWAGGQLELLNTLSCLPWMWDMYCRLRRHPMWTTTFHMQLSAFFVAAGSLLLHGTLSIWGQWMDEVSILCYLVWFWKMLDRDIPAWTLVTSMFVLYSAVHRMSISVFVVAFISLICVALLRCSHTIVCDCDLLIGFLYLLAGFWIWLLDMALCVTWLPCHAVWHVFVWCMMARFEDYAFRSVVQSRSTWR